MKSTFEKARAVLENGGIVAFKTDTVMGIAVNGFDQGAVKKLFDIKGRSYNKPVAVLTYSVSKIFQYAVVSETAFSIIKLKFPGAITCIMRLKEKIFTTPMGTGKTVGIRIPDFPELLEFLSILPFPVVATSANFAGKNLFATKEEIFQAFSGTVYYLDFEYNITMSNVASTVVDCSTGEVKILREGSIKL
jgi:L-threonylcarbamoyladenylate synthase